MCEFYLVAVSSKCSVTSCDIGLKMLQSVHAMHFEFKAKIIIKQHMVAF